MRCGAFHRVEGTLCLVRHGQAALSGSKTKAPGFAGGYLLVLRHSRYLGWEPIEFKSMKIISWAGAGSYCNRGCRRHN
jgi:hypothetical protein